MSDEEKKYDYEAPATLSEDMMAFGAVCGRSGGGGGRGQGKRHDSNRGWGERLGWDRNEHSSSKDKTGAPKFCGRSRLMS